MRVSRWPGGTGEAAAQTAEAGSPGPAADQPAASPVEHGAGTDARGLLDPCAVRAESLARALVQSHAHLFGSARPDYAALLAETARDAMTRIDRTTALYHNSEHTVLVTLAARAIVAGRAQVERVTPEDWLHFMLGALLHDIGFTAGACRGDTAATRVIGENGEMLEMPRGASDAVLQAHHVLRGEIHARERFAGHPFVDAERVAENIRWTFFPVRDPPEFSDTSGEPGLVRAADLIGQLADPNYLAKSVALFHELAECGAAAQIGYETPADVVERFPAFYDARVSRFLGPALGHLARTPEGRQWVARLEANIEAPRRHGAAAVALLAGVPAGS
jgi:hypothetical protein